MKKLFLLIIVLLFATAANLYATPIAGIADTSVSGSDMAGMLVTVKYANGTSYTETWKAMGGDRGLAQKVTGQNNPEWSLEFDGPETWFSNNLDDAVTETGRYTYWEFNTNQNVSAITINAIAGNFVFDIFSKWNADGSSTGFPNTDGSADGWWQENSFLHDNTSGGPTSDNFYWEFTDPATINGTIAGDLFGSLTINFDNPGTNDTEFMTGHFQFGVDTDKVAPIPEPATMFLLGMGLLGLTGLTRRKKQ